MPPEWGKVLASERADARQRMIKMFCIAAVLIALGVGLFIWRMNSPGPEALFGLILAGIGAICALDGFYAAREGDFVLQFYEGGVQRASAKRPLRLNYREVDAVSYESRVGNGLAAVTLCLYTSEGLKKPALRWYKLIDDKPGKPDELWVGMVDGVAKQIARVVATRMKEDLAAGRTVRLTEKIKLEPTGIRTADGKLVRFSDLDAPLFEGQVVAGSLELKAGGENVLAIGREDANYLPARLLLDDNRGWLRGSDVSRAEASGEVKEG